MGFMSLELTRYKSRKTDEMAESGRLTYTSDEFRDILVSLYGPTSDWELASLAAPDFNVRHLTVYRWLTGDRQISGTPAAVTYLLKHPPAKEKNVMVFQASESLPPASNNEQRRDTHPECKLNSEKTDYDRGYCFIVPDQVITRGFADYDAYESRRTGFRPSMVANWSEHGDRTVVQFHGTSKFMILAIRYDDFNDLLERAAAGHKAD
jgi:hypothetical protein